MRGLCFLRGGSRGGCVFFEGVCEGVVFSLRGFVRGLCFLRGGLRGAHVFIEGLYKGVIFSRWG